LIGFSTHSCDQIRAADADPAVDVVAVGPVFTTVSKAGAGPAVGLDLVRRARALTRKPLVAIGGIDAERVRSVLAAGADSVAVLGALGGGMGLGAREIEANVRRLRAAVETTT
jgi:thiamine-phosphate pyrophosphorylase